MILVIEANVLLLQQQDALVEVQKAMAHLFDLIRSRFPKYNPRVDAAAKDSACVATQPRELLSIVNQLYVLKSNGFGGQFLEFGCFKGFSSCCLRHCCHELGIPM